MADAWEKCHRSDWMLWALDKIGYDDQRMLRLLACRFCREIWHLLADERSRNAVEVAERYAEGQATKDELVAARAAAWAAARAAARARAAAGAAAEAATEAAAWAAAWAATEAAARGAGAAAWAATEARQADIIREMIGNPFAVAQRTA